MEWSDKRKSFFKNHVNLILSGGGSLGLFHLGIVKKLYELDLLPNKIHGSSVGSIIASVCCCYSNEELTVFLNKIVNIYIEFFDTPWWYSIVQLLKTKNIHSGEKLIIRMKELIGDITFQEAYNKTGRQLNITIACMKKNKGYILNYKNSPHVVIWSAVSCSTALPGFFPDRNLYIKDDDVLVSLPDSFNDGAIFMDIPDVPCKLKMISITNPLLILLNRWYQYTHNKIVILKIIDFLYKLNIHRYWIVKMIISMMDSHWDFKHTYYLPIRGLIFMPFMMFNPPKFLWKKWISYGYNSIHEKALQKIIQQISEASLYKEEIPE